MGKKNLLNESTITRFMKLAAINENAAQAFVGTIHEEDEEELAGDELAGDELAADDELAGDELAADDELAGDELAADDELAGGEGGTEGAVKDMVDAVVGAISDVADDHGVQVELDVEGGGDELAGDELAGDELAGDELAGDELAGDELAGDELAADDALAGEEEPDLELESQIRSIVAEMLNEEGEAPLQETEAGDELETSSPGRGEKAGDEAYINEEDDADLEESHGRGRRETAQHTGDRTVDRGLNESIQIVDDGILVQEVTNRVFTRLQKMLNERKKTK